MYFNGLLMWWVQSTFRISSVGTLCVVHKYINIENVKVAIFSNYVLNRVSSLQNVIYDFEIRSLPGSYTNTAPVEEPRYIAIIMFYLISYRWGFNIPRMM